MNIGQFRVEVKDDAGDWVELVSVATRLAAIRLMNEHNGPARVRDTETGSIITKPE